MHYLWLASFFIMSLRFICVFVCNINQCLSQYIMTVDKYLGCFQRLQRALLWIVLYSILHTQACFLEDRYLGLKSHRAPIASICPSAKLFTNVVCTNLSVHQQCLKTLVTPHPQHCLLPAALYMLGDLIVIWWYLIADGHDFPD